MLAFPVIFKIDYRCTMLIRVNFALPDDSIHKKQPSKTNLKQPSKLSY